MSRHLSEAAKHAHHAVTSNVIHVPSIRYLGILPVIVMLGGAVVLLGMSSLVKRPLRLRVATATTLIISLTAFGLAWWQWADVQSRGPYTTIDHAVVVDGLAVLITVLVTAAMALSALVAEGYLAREGIDGAELHVLAMVSAAGAILMAEANDLVIVFLGLEILSIALYVLTAFNHKRAASGEAALKYFILGGFSSAIFVYGIALTYGATGTTNLTQIASFLSHNVLVHDGVLLAGMSLLLVGFAFKIAAVPFHMWTPDVYPCTPSPVTGFMAAVAKAGGFAAFLRVFVSSFGVLASDWRPIIYALAIVTLVVGAGLAVVQRDIKRMLAYSGIAQAGYILIGLALGRPDGTQASLYYLAGYAVMNTGAFAVVTILSDRGEDCDRYSQLTGLSRRQPLLAGLMALFMLSLAGFPLTVGFFGKFFLFSAAIHDGQLPLAIWGILTSAVSLFYYLRVILVMYTRVPAPGAVVDAAGVSVPGAALAGGELAGAGALSRGGLGVVALAAAGTLILGVFPAVIYALLQGVSVVRG